MKLNSIIGIEPQIKEVDFKQRGFIRFVLEDGRIILCPLQLFPFIKKLNREERNQYFILGKGEGIVWEHSDFILHLQDILGVPSDYMHKDSLQQFVG